MSASETAAEESRMWLDWLFALFLALATAAIVFWQNSRLAVLWDLSYILENSYRISLSDIPYRDFPFPYAPLTFLAQAALIRVAGRVFFHHVIYCAVVGGLATLIGWRILWKLLRTTPRGRLLALLLTAPCTVLGIYSIFPHPFYDPDCTFAVLVALLLLLQLEEKGFPSLRAFLTGVALVIPLFVKQNTGLGFLVSAAGALAVLFATTARRRHLLRGYLWLFVGLASGLAIALLVIHFTAGLGNYVGWTVRFAASRRAPSFHDMLTVYQDSLLKWWIPAFAAGALLLQRNRTGDRRLAVISGVLMLVPFAWPVVYLFLDNDSSERAERLLALWPFLLIISFVFALLNVRRRNGITAALPFIVIGTVNGAFLSQQLWGSTYALWPLFMILLATTVDRLSVLGKLQARWIVLPLMSLITVSLVISGGFYAWSHERLDYSNLTDGEMAHSSLPPLRGLSMRGSWIPDFEELVDYTEREIPKEDGILMIPGEDLFYYTTGRHPRFPVVMMDHTVNPYSPQEILALARERNIRWLIVKGELQLEEEPVEHKDELMNLLFQDFEQVESLNNYDIYQRKSATPEEEEEK